MKILLVADYEMRELWDYWNTAGKRRTEGVELILSAGDIRPQYLEFLVTMLNVPCLYVRGNHDGYYDEQPPRGCIDIDGRICELKIPCAANTGSTDAGDAAGRPQAAGPGVRTLRVAGLGGSMRYREGPDMYTEKEMRRRVRALRRSLRLGKVILPDGRLSVSRELAREYRAVRRRPASGKPDQLETVSSEQIKPVSLDLTSASEPYRTDAGSPDLTSASEPYRTDAGSPDRTSAGSSDQIRSASMKERAPVDILLTHAPSFGHGDMDDLPHRGFKCFNDLIDRIRPQYHCYGHVHPEYDPLMKRSTVHLAGTQLINVGGMYILEI